ncbi:hypothetical protein BDV95DRAFT_613641 [Massariosphaeria phaeospora]|uniref:Uncharacterized protein n=1 Tax=Massariosphaeria phaeospora TaxID=100035 RepID=A0A7C8MJR9_9PLEO|nr:hypothetical protein BDV95DRAFT_613641 [Massariosphaeria phaeospora]
MKNLILLGFLFAAQSTAKSCGPQKYAHDGLLARSPPELPPLTGPFELIVFSPLIPEIDGLPVHANNFILTAGPNATTNAYCPGTCPCGNPVVDHTYWTVDESWWNMKVQTPDGQKAYITNYYIPMYTPANETSLAWLA